MANITKLELENDLYDLKSALRKAGYDPHLILTEYREIHGLRVVKKRKRPEKLTTKGKKVMAEWASKSDKSCGIFKETG